MKDLRQTFLEALPSPDVTRFKFMDETSGNLTYTRRYGRAAAITACGVRLLFLPPYSLDFTPVELAFGKLRTRLRTAQARTRDTLAQALRTALNWISETTAKNLV